MSADEILDEWERDAQNDVDYGYGSLGETQLKLIAGYRELRAIRDADLETVIGGGEYMKREGFNQALSIMRQIIDEALGVSE